MRHEPEMGLAATKLQPPTLPANLVSRKRLADRLDDSVSDQTRLVLVSSPAGSGKSTLVASWVADRSVASAWLQIEQSDADPARFWTYLVEAIGRARPGLATVVRPVIAASNHDGDMIVSSLVTALSDLSDPFVVVLDDYHLIQNPEIHRSVERLIELCPGTVTVVMLARHDPPFRLGRLRVRKHLVELRSGDLRFALDETSWLLGGAGEVLSSSDIGILSERTEGWAAGLVLAGLSIERSEDPHRFVEDFHGDDKIVVDYLSDEFLAALGIEDRSRLVAMSIVEQFNGALVDAITGTSDGKSWLSETAVTNQLLVGLDHGGEWFRYHHLLRGLLRVEATETIAAELSDLHRRAARWFEIKDDLRRAAHHWLDAGDHHEAARLMYFYGPHLLAEGQVQTLRSVLEALGDVGKGLAWCCLLWGWCEFIDGRYALAEEWIGITHDVAPDTFDATTTTPLEMNIFLGRGDVNSALTIARGLSLSGRLDVASLEQAVVAGGVFTWAGDAEQARLNLTEAIDTAIVVQAKTPQLLGMVYRAIVEFDAGEMAVAHRTAVEVLEKAIALGVESYYRLGPAHAIRARTATSDLGALADSLRAVELVRATTGDLPLAYVLTMCGDTLIDLDDSSGRDLLAEARVVVDRCPDPGIVGRYLDRVESRHGLEAVRSEVEQLVEQLTGRENAVLRYLPTTLSQREIARELFVSHNTVKTHCGAIYRKLGVGDRKAAVQAARDLRIL